MLDIRYVAGLFDGEGCVRINRWFKPGSVHVRYNVFAFIGMTHKPVIDELMAQFGGSVHCNHHSRKSPRHRDQFVWIVASQKAASFLRTVLPYLIVKRDEAMLALELQDSINRWNHRLRLAPERSEVLALRDDLFRRVSALKHRRFHSHSVAP